MNDENGSIDLREFQRSFEKLQTIVYKDIVVNGTGVRVLGIHFMDFGPGWNIRKHRHSFFEFHYVTDNYTHASINDIEQKVVKGSFYIMTPGTYHSHWEEPDSRHIGFALRWEFTGDEKEELRNRNISSDLEKCQNILKYAHSRPVSDNGMVMKAFSRILKCADDTSSVLELQLHFLQLILAITDYYREDRAYTGTDVNRGLLENGIVESAIRFIDENYMQDIDVKDVAGSIHMSYSHLSRLFKKYTEHTINHYLNLTRLSKSQKLLMCGNLNLERIAEQVGFNGEHYFCTMFKKYYGISPGSYRKSKASLTE